MKINVRSNTDKIIKEMGSKAKKQAPYATSKAINVVAKSCQKEIQKQINSQIDNPTAFTKKGTFVKYSNKNDKPIVAIVGINDIQARYLLYVEDGGVSIAIGKAKPVPVDSFKNKAGNIPRGKIKRILSDKKRYFSGTPNGGGRPSGLYQRPGTTSNARSPKLRMLASWQKQTRHTPRTRFGERVALRVHRDIEKELRRQIIAAMR
jgi:hypothetical protein